MHSVERFLERNDLAIFRGKMVFCMSCQSKDLGVDAIENGAIAFVGFDEVPFHRVDATGAIISNQKFETRRNGSSRTESHRLC